MFQQFLVAVAGLTGIAAASNNTIGSNGYQNFTTEAFVLELDNANQVATGLTSRPGANSGDAPFNFLLPTPSRTDDGNYATYKYACAHKIQMLGQMFLLTMPVKINGVNIALHALSTRAVAVHDASLGGWSGFGATVKCAANVVTIIPVDSFRQRLFIAENALYMELDAGHLTSVLYDTQTGSVKVTFDVDDGYTPNARIRWTTSASTPSSHNYTLCGNYTIERGCSVVPLTPDDPVTITFI